MSPFWSACFADFHCLSNYPECRRLAARVDFMMSRAFISISIVGFILFVNVSTPPGPSYDDGRLDCCRVSRVCDEWVKEVKIAALAFYNFLVLCQKNILMLERTNTHTHTHIQIQYISRCLGRRQSCTESLFILKTAQACSDNNQRNDRQTCCDALFIYIWFFFFWRRGGGSYLLQAVDKHHCKMCLDYRQWGEQREGRKWLMYCRSIMQKTAAAVWGWSRDSATPPEGTS